VANGCGNQRLTGWVIMKAHFEQVGPIGAIALIVWHGHRAAAAL